MNFLQRFFKRILPANKAHEMEMSSRQWVVICPSCSWERSIWELGGIRWGAQGKTKTYMKCPSCGKRNWVTLHKKQEVPVPEREVELNDIINKV
jgi:transposase-like protein